jgi:hypothetical protein
MTLLIQLNESGEPINYPVEDGNFRALFPNRSFPNLLTPQAVEGTGFAMYEFSQQPNLNRYEKLLDGAPRKAEDGRVFQTWQVVEMDENEKMTTDANQADLIRSQRDMILRSTDWVFNPDVSLSEETKQAYVVYRQTLRDVPAQSGFPWGVQWPTKPE